jgi:DNA helicase-2/ATP-dependent DNA helicase PcrA
MHGSVAGTPGLSAQARALILEEEAWLERAQVAIAAEKRKHEVTASSDGHRSVEALRRLRDEALGASEDDLPGVLHEMSVRQTLIERGERVLPDVLAPYFAHLRVNEHGVTRDYLLGPASLVDAKAGVRIVDWRVAPIARVFYQYREGDEYEEEFPGRIAEGTVTGRRLVVIEAGRLVRILAGSTHLVRRAGGQWEEEAAEQNAFASGGAESAARAGTLGTRAKTAGLPAGVDVTALLDPEQFAAVSTSLDTPLVVLGSAGSGKTTVALHRLARIGPADGVGHVVVPEEGLARLWRRLLQPFDGETASDVETLDAWALRLAREVFGEKLPKITPDTPGLVASLKRHPALFQALGEAIAPSTRSRGESRFKRHRKKLALLLTDRAFLEGVVDGAAGGLSRVAVEETVRHTMHQLGESFERELRAIVVPEMKRAVDGRRIVDGTPDELAGTIDAEDLPLVLWLHARTGGALPSGRVVHLVLDEAEDFASFELDVMGRMLGASSKSGVTLAGDEAQQTSSCFSGWDDTLACLGAKRAETVRLAVSYRCPEPVTAFAHAVLGPLATETAVTAARAGAPVGLFRFPAAAQAELLVATAVTDLADREPRASIAVIAADEAAAARLFELVSRHPTARLVLNGEFTFEPGIDVTHVDAVKGLEFDYVVVPDATAAAYPATDDARRRLHVAATRAAHQLWVVASGEASPLLPPAA